ncbi:hypothetical protein [Leptolyngbya sp. FACHB-711]|uniref:hypothetical protein n=1 Tax=unclassified Leptolyngbya TaxID=2650499 RepID=UPI001685B2B2|nr:hypothetical protein [Leptolyngbya sp. FACHB-711]MBD1849702.1 hypothetical protein [Cyanobacteria bacterium FACHB-502]MBD2027950.1 hypothetical protein [Leptolyngbya sp. FACHB-711]
MAYLIEPQTVVGWLLHERFERQAVKIVLLGNPHAVDQCVIELERKGFCDSYAWSPSLNIRENAPPIQPLPGELMRLYKRWYPPTAQRIFS